MKTRKILWMMAAILTCGAMVFTSCSNDDKDADIENLSEKIRGKWMPAASNGNPLTTNEKAVYTFVSTTKAYVSASNISHSEIGDHWIDQLEGEVSINGNKMTVTTHPDENRTMVEEFTVTSINDNNFTANRKITFMVDGNVAFTSENVVRYEKIKADYRTAIIGTWEGRCTSEGSVFDDGQVHRWQYKADGTYVYYVKDGDNWVPAADNTLNEYFVEGTLLCSRWVDDGQENREWWEITISGNKMNWTALRQNADKTTFTATFEMTKVE